MVLVLLAGVSVCGVRCAGNHHQAAAALPPAAKAERVQMLMLIFIAFPLVFIICFRITVYPTLATAQGDKMR